MSAENKWFKIDNAGLIFVPSSNKKWTANFRVACVLKEKIDADALQQAVDDLTPRFPSLMVNVKWGLFWNYLESVSKPPLIEKETLYPCQRFDIKSRVCAIRILYYNCRISVEAFHAVTDGGGAIKYLMSLVKRYLEICGAEIASFEGCLDYNDPPLAEETEDSFLRYAVKGAGRKYGEKKTLRADFEKEKPYVLNVTNGQLSLKRVKEVAKKYEATVGQFITACLFQTICGEPDMKKPRKSGIPVKIAIPIDLRRKYQSKTVRNFSSYINMELEYNPSYQFEEVLELTKKQFKLIDDGYLLSSISANVANAGHPLVRVMPLFVKNIVLSAAYKLFSERLSTLSFSNIGAVKAPPEFENYVERFEFYLGAPRINAVSVASACYLDKLVISLSGCGKNNNFERRFFGLLMSFGLDVVVDGNREAGNKIKGAASNG